MVNRISGKPVVQFHFSSDGTAVECRLNVMLKRLNLTARMAFASTLWNSDVVSRLAKLELELELARQAILNARERYRQLFAEERQIRIEASAAPTGSEVHAHGNSSHQT